LIAWLTNPLSPIIAGTLADFVFEPAMNANGTFSPLLGKFIGIGPGSGMGSLMVLCGIFGVCIGLSGYLFPIVARAEEILPDYTPLKLSPNTLE
jgi:hypothetical protein